VGEGESFNSLGVGQIRDPSQPLWKKRERVFCLLKGIAEGTYNTKHAEAARLYYTTILLCYYTTLLLLLAGRRELEAIQALRRATRAGVTRGELGGEPQSSSSSLEATSDGAAELSEGGEGRHATNSSGQET